MIELLKIEFLKIKNHNIFRAFMLLYFILLPGLFYTLSLIDFPFFPTGSDLFQFPEVWGFLTYTAGWFNVLPGILVVSLVCNEITYKTQKQNVIDGLSRLEVILSKFYLVFVLAIVLTVYIIVLAVVLGAITSNISDIFQDIEKIGYFFIQTLGTLSLALLLAVIIRKSALAVIAYIILFILAGVIAGYTMGDDLSQWMPFNLMNDLTPNPWMEFINKLQRLADPNYSAGPVGIALWVKAMLSLAYIGGFVFLSYFIMKKRDL